MPAAWQLSMNRSKKYLCDVDSALNENSELPPLEIVARLRTQLRTLSYGYRQKLISKGISVVVSEEPDVCSIYGGKWHVQKSTIRKCKTPPKVSSRLGKPCAYANPDVVTPRGPG